MTAPADAMMTHVTTAPVASSTFDTSRVHSLTRPNMVSVGMIIWLSSELMFFAGLFAMYFTARAPGHRRLAAGADRTGHPVRG